MKCIWLSIGLIVLLILLVWIGSWFAICRSIPDWQSRGQFGDMFGAANAIFSGLALAGVVIAVVLQSRELQLQRDELALTRQELARSAAAHEGSLNAFKEQLKTQLLTAKLNALSAILSSYDAQISALEEENRFRKHRGGGIDNPELREARKKCQLQINEILADLET